MAQGGTTPDRVGAGETVFRSKSSIVITVHSTCISPLNDLCSGNPQ
jgi:hypothetical protein